ncbi:MAG TPA: histidine--tRNA ligase [Thermoflexia bacterium]|nr:MAG: histidine--tRNA ligase [Chloroflexota bacterium]HEY68946.1 histidine--tRNA ligase [Thermoflexia bacterium]
MPRYQRPIGTRDIMPEDQPYWYYVRDRARHLAELAGFERIDVPIFEATELFARGVGEGTDIVDKEMYSFTDRGGRQLTLRPEFTAGVVRAYIENGMRVRLQPVKLYTFGPTFRYDRPQKGRYRQFTQFNVEILGEQDPAADLEVMLLAWDLYASLGFRDLAFQLNSTGCPQCKPGYVAVLKEYYAGHEDEICQDCRRRLERSPLRVLDCKAKQCQPIIAGAPHILDHLCTGCAEHFATLREYLDLLDRSYTINHRLVRGLDYYTKTVFEVWAAGIGAQSAVCGGGRYDGLAELLGGPPTPGVGFGSGLERIIMVMKELNVEVPPLPKPSVFLAHLGPEAKREALRLVNALRQADVGAYLAFGERGLKNQLREAGKRGVRYAVILGEDELAAGTATVRDMEAGEQTSVELAWLVEWLKARV